jgi:NTE family protein
MTPAMLSTIPFLRDVGSSALRDVAKSAVHYCVPSGCPLFLDKEPADTIWFVISGSLAAFRQSIDGSKQDFVGHIRKGEPVGEFALIAGEPHSGSVFALRDSEVLALDRSTFNRLIRRHPELMANLARTVLFRSRQNRRKNPRAEPRIFALIGAASTINVKARAGALQAALAKIGKTALIVEPSVGDFNGTWFEQAERTYDIIILVVETQNSAWANLCQRQADRIWIFARADAPPDPSARALAHSASQRFQMIDLVLVKAAGSRAVTFASEWRAATGALRIFHWCDTTNGHVDRLARVIAGNSIGLVLGGGGARAYAHIGAVRALREAGYGFDFVGGTSMGGVIAACIAMGWSDSEIERRIYEAFVRTSPLDDFLMPVVALTAGKKVDRRLAENFGDIKIDDLDIPFFCVSTNLTKGINKVHNSGGLAASLRASIALPGILPPVVWDDDVLVDGAVLDNFPVSTMRDLHRGANIGIDVAQQHAVNGDDFRNPPSFLRWVLKHGLKKPPPIAELLMRSATATLVNANKTDEPDFLIIPQLAGVELRDWKAFDQGVEAGYSATTRALQSTPAALRIASNRAR